MVSRYTCNEDFFSSPTTISGYWAGFIAADGAIVHGTSSYLNLHLSVKDQGHIKRFSEMARATNPIHYGKANDVTSNYYYRLWVNDLDSVWNIRSNKTHNLRPPGVTDSDVIKSFVVGYIDGDGCWDWHRTNTGSYLRLQIEGTKEILDWISDNMPEPGYMVYRKPPRDRYYLRYVGRRAKIVDDYLRTIDVPRLERKWRERPWKM